MTILKKILNLFSRTKCERKTSEKINIKNYNSSDKEESTYDVQLKNVKVQKIKIKK